MTFIGIYCLDFARPVLRFSFYISIFFTKIARLRVIEFNGYLTKSFIFYCNLFIYRLLINKIYYIFKTQIKISFLFL